MPSGRLGRCIIPARTGVELYVNSSGSEASVTIQTQVISTTANVEQTVVVGVAATVLRQDTTVTTSPVGTYTSISGLNYSCWQGAPGISTINGAFRTPICCLSNSGNFVEGTYCDTGSQGIRFIDPNSGNQTFSVNHSCICGVKEHNGSNFQCCYKGMYGGNELQNPLIWLMQESDVSNPGGRFGFPRTCSCCNWFWGEIMIGWNPGQKYGMCCGSNATCQPSNDDNLMRAAHVIGCTGSGNCNGVGVFKTDIAITTMQMYIAPCCCCGYTAANTWPVAKFDASGCSNNASCCGGAPCNYAFCKGKNYLCCHQGRQCCGQTLGFNWYALCHSAYCCYRCTSQLQIDWTCACCDRSGSSTTPYGNMNPSSAEATLNCCFPCFTCGTIMGPLVIRMGWCGNSRCCNNGADGWVQTGYWATCNYHNSQQCGVMKFVEQQDNSLCNCCCVSGGYQWYHTFRNKYMCNCTCMYNRSYRARAGDQNLNYIMSPYGFDHGMTNCYWAHHKCSDSVGAGGRHTYLVGWPNPQVAGGSCRSRCSCYCYWAKAMYLRMCGPTDTKHAGNEYPIKYVAWNPFDSYVYMAVRSPNPLECGIFRIDPDKQRKFHGPHCGCDVDNGCAGCVQEQSFWLSTWDVEMKSSLLDYCKISDWPTCWSQAKYNLESFCVSCLFRNQRCNWVMDIFNHTTAKWDSYSTSNLHQWNLVNDSSSTDPFKLKINDTLDLKVSDNCACIITTCNCFMSNMDCSGLIDWCISANQYERNGIVLSNGDRVMINNNSDEKLNAQIWGYEG